MHTSAKSRWRNDVIVAMAMPVSACPALQRQLMPLSVSPFNVKSGIGKQSLYPDGDPDCHQNLIICLLADYQPSVKISCKVANRQTMMKT